MAILVFTVIFFFLYKYRCMKILYGWLGLSVAMLLGFSGGALSYSLIISLSKTQAGWFPSIDVYSFMFLQTNFAAMGVLVVFWKSPLIVKQVYLIIASCIMAWVLSRYFPDWTTWALLFGLSVYDIFAVLSPCGPLKALVELSQDRGDAIPGLVYEAAPPEKRAGRSRQERVKLGLGDFVFYSVLIGRAAIFDFTTVVTCFLAILTGLILTLFCLAVFRKALPALPFSIFLGIATFLVSKAVLIPFLQPLQMQQVLL
ncbi:hypothetical protein GUITHDRAFT_159148 [Guillardia theta CCMP2712]|uniref:Presenilin n=1 Tax=Guillardia theta (strain CCMP2712) TaxID=905079 RepID=L1K229_GUITC|nr:hypothetical protein GUITHDRAFT_159148 [Guillardia theta CCMP2712]EKX54652.1 hypothetical protein GUITHDRAFT_159148 [Guillardia theta CCMP2712]|eukprot:XP_005841632.1 hypothetical protein GUITHDRAFT_159148 [Guillardia theta CCMP2712]